MVYPESQRILKQAHWSRLDRHIAKSVPPLAESEERYRMLVEGVKQYAIFMLNPEGIILTRNRGIQELLGYTRDRFWVNQEKSFLVPPIGRRVAFKKELGQAKRELTTK